MRVSPKTTLRQHQINLSDTWASRPKSFHMGDPGTQKTLTGLRYFSLLHERDGAKKFLVLTPKSALTVWEEDHDSFMEDGRVVTLNKGTSKKKQKLIEELPFDEPTIVVVNYGTAKLMELQRIEWDACIADESHYLKSHNSQTSMVLAVRLAHVPNKVAMTGTPYSDRPTDVYGQVRWLSPALQKLSRGGYSEKRVYSKVFGTWADFFSRYVDYYRIDNIFIIKGYIRQEELADKFKDVYSETLAKDVLKDLPPLVSRNHYIDMPRPFRKLYKQMEEENAAAIEGDLTDLDNVMVAANPLVRELRLHQLTSGFWQPLDPERDPELLPNHNDLKLKVLEGIAEELGTRPFVVFTRFRADVPRIRKLLGDMGIKTKELTGDVDEHLSWRKGAGQALIANLQAGSTGVRLERAAYAVYYSMGTSRTEYVQSLARLRRPGQEADTVFAHFIVVRDSVDELMLDRMKTKAEHENRLQKELNK
jgi:SNF2 family DNA or RNA helicase